MPFSAANGLIIQQLLLDGDDALRPRGDEGNVACNLLHY